MEMKPSSQCVSNVYVSIKRQLREKMRPNSESLISFVIIPFDLSDAVMSGECFSNGKINKHISQHRETSLRSKISFRLLLPLCDR